MDDLLSSEEDKRREALVNLQSRFEARDKTIYEDFQFLMKVIESGSDDFITLQIANGIGEFLSGDNQFIKSHFQIIKQTLNSLSKRDMESDESLWSASTIHILNLLQPIFPSDISILKECIPLLLRLMQKKSSIKWSAYSPISTIITTNPRLLSDHVSTLFDISSQFPEIITLLPMLYNFNSSVFEDNIEALMKIYNSQPNQQSGVLSILLEIAKKDTSQLLKYVDIFKQGLSSPTNAFSSIAILTEIARNDPSTIFPLINDIMDSLNYVPSIKYQVSNLFGLIARHSDEYATVILPFLDELTRSVDHSILPLVLGEFRNIAEMNKELIVPYVENIKKWENDPEESIRDQVNLIIDIIEGRDIRSLFDRIEEQNKQISDIVNSLDDLRKYVDENIDVLKEFIGEISKKLPLPIEFSTEGKLRKTIILFFGCSRQNNTCLYPQNRLFMTETKAWNRWLKIGFSAVRLGKSIILPPNPGDAIQSVKKAYDSFKGKDDVDFLNYIKEPFLTSEEQDLLISQLNKANFFTVFNYDAKNAGWACIMCNPPSL